MAGTLAKRVRGTADYKNLMATLNRRNSGVRDTDQDGQ